MYENNDTKYDARGEWRLKFITKRSLENENVYEKIATLICKLNVCGVHINDYSMMYHASNTKPDFDIYSFTFWFSIDRYMKKHYVNIFGEDYWFVELCQHCIGQNVIMD